MLTTTGCSVEDFNLWINGGLFSNDTAVRDSGTQPQANTQGYLLGGFDIKSVTDDVLDGLPEYDFSGPSNYTDGLNAGGITVSDKEVGNTSKVSVYLAPAYVGTLVPPMLPRTESVKKKIEKKVKADPVMSASDVWIELFKVHTGRKTETAYSRLYNDYRDDLIPANDVGISCKSGPQTYYEYVFDWQICRLVGDKLSSKGCNVYFSHNGSYDGGYRLSTFDAAEQGWDTISADIKEKSPKVVIIIGFNSNGADSRSPSSSSGTFVGCIDGSRNLALSIVKRYAADCASIGVPLQETKVSDNVKDVKEGYVSLLSGSGTSVVQICLGGFAANIAGKTENKRYDNKEFQDGIANAIAAGVSDYLQANYQQ